MKNLVNDDLDSSSFDESNNDVAMNLILNPINLIMMSLMNNVLKVKIVF